MIASINSGSLILVNAKHPISSECEPVLAPVLGNNEILLDARASLLLDDLISQIDANGIIVPVSGYRSQEEQQQIWDDSMRENGESFTRKFVAIPGCSEHQTGLAIDLALASEQIDFICPDFPYDGICGQFRALAPDYGFIERYPAGKEQITGIGCEPWHFRYVGRPHAQLMTAMKLTLEEYVELLRDYPYPTQNITAVDDSYSAQVYFASPEQLPEMTPDSPLQISGNNIDGYIITTWRITA